MKSTMKKPFLIASAVLCCLSLSAQEKGNYQLIINNSDTIRLNLDENKTFKFNKKDLSIKLIQPELLSYEDEMVSFDYTKDISLTSSIIEKGVMQTIAMNSVGNGFMLQKYSTLNPTSLNDIMLQEITKESINYGYEMKEEPFNLILKSGQTLKGVKAVLEYNGDVQEFIVATYGQKDSGILVLTMINNMDFVERDQKTIDQFFNSLRILN